MRIVELTPPQIVTFFGWFNLKPYLRWDDIPKNPNITFRSLRAAGLTPTQLHTIQPDVQQWKTHGSITLHDCVEMTLWPAHPIHVMKADLADIISMRWSPEQMVSLGINVDELMELGMIADLMTMFVFSLSSWVTIGLTQKHVTNMSDVEILRVFRMSRMQVLCSTPKVNEITNNTPKVNEITNNTPSTSGDENTQTHKHLIRPVGSRKQ
jgi:hypothetical protein